MVRIRFFLFLLFIGILTACAPATPPTAKPASEPGCAAKYGNSGALHVVWENPSGQIKAAPTDAKMYDLVVFVAGNYPDAPVRSASTRSFGEYVKNLREKADVGISVDGYTVTGSCPDGDSAPLSFRDGDIVLVMVNIKHADQGDTGTFTTRSILYKVTGSDPMTWKPVDSLMWDPSFDNPSLLADFTDPRYKPELTFVCGERTYAVVARRGANLDEHIRPFDFRFARISDKYPVDVTVERIDASTVRFACYGDQKTYMLGNLTASDSLWVATQAIDQTFMSLVTGPVR